MRRFLVPLLFALLAGAATAHAQYIAPAGGDSPDASDFVGYAPGRIVVKFDPTMLRGIDRAQMARGRTGLPALDQVGTRHGVRSVRPQFPGAKKKTYKGKEVDLSGWHEVELPEGVDLLAAVAEYKAVPGVLDAQPVGIHKVQIAPNDYNYVNYPYQWHLPRIQASFAWEYETGNPDIVVAVLDTGVRYFHRDLGGADASFSSPAASEGNMWINTAERYGVAEEDDDGNGYVDDWIGWDFVNVQDNWPLMVCFPGEDCLEPDNDPRDFQGHGTHCAGNVASMNNNSYSQASVAGGWGDGNFTGGPGNGVRVMDLRIGWRAIYGVLFDVGLVDMGFAAQALRYAADHGARIASCSWGSNDSGAIGEAIDYFLAGGGIIFKAAGNESSQNADYMCARGDVLCVAATDQGDCKASFSNYGSWVDVSAPGVGIWSSWHNPDDPAMDYITTMDGTSMSTPLAASVAALIWSQNQGWTADQVRQKLQDSADPIDGLSCNLSFPGMLGAGRINPYKAVFSAAPPPPPVAGFSASPTSGNAPLAVTFTDGSTGSVTSWSWTFGDGGTSSERNPAHTYGAAGSYTVTLDVTGPGGSDTHAEPDFITVTAPPFAPVAEFLASPRSGDAPLRVDFTDLSEGTISAWNWNFGDGYGATIRNPSHIYESPGTYTVTLTVSGDSGEDTETKPAYITVFPIPAPDQAGVTGIATGIYSGRGKTKTFEARTVFSRGDEVVFRASVTDGAVPIPGAVVDIGISGPEATSLTTAPSDGDGIAEAKWKTSSRKGKNPGTATGDYTATVTNVTAAGFDWDGIGTSTGFGIR